MFVQKPASCCHHSTEPPPHQAQSSLESHLSHSQKPAFFIIGLAMLSESLWFLAAYNKSYNYCSCHPFWTCWTKKPAWHLPSVNCIQRYFLYSSTLSSWAKPKVIFSSVFLKDTYSISSCKSAFVVTMQNMGEKKCRDYMQSASRVVCHEENASQVKTKKNTEQQISCRQ